MAKGKAKPKQLNPKLRNEIKENLKQSLLKYVSAFTYRSNHPLDLLIPKERKIRSLVGGLETSMGTTVWEPIAKTLAAMNGFEVIRTKILKPEPFPSELAAELGRVISLRENITTHISIEECKERFRKICRKIDTSNVTYVAPPAGTGVDIWLRKDDKEYAYDTKTVQPNVGSIKSFNKQILEWYAYRICKDPEVDIQCAVAYPFNPFKDDFWRHTPHTNGILQPRVDALVENEFWNFLSGFENTYSLILEIFRELNDEGLGLQLSEIIEQLE